MSVLLFTLLGIIACALPALLVLLPPIRRRANASMRWRVTLLFGLISFGLCFWQMAYFTAGIASFEYYVPPDYFHHVGDNDPEHVARDMQRIHDFGQSMRVAVDDLTVRLLLPPQAVYSDSPCYTEQELCERLKAMQATTVSWSSYLLRLFGSGFSGLLSGGLVWLLTRKPNRPKRTLAPIDRAGIGCAVSLGVQSPTDDPFRRDVEDVWSEPRTNRLTTRREGLCSAPNFDPTSFPWIDRGEVVNDDGDMSILLDITPFFALGKPSVTADVKGIRLRIVTESHRRDVRLTVGADGGDAAELLAFEIGDFGGRKYARDCFRLMISHVKPP